MQAKIRGFMTRRIIPLMISGLIILGVFIAIVATGFIFSATWQIVIALLIFIALAGVIYAIAQDITKKLLKWKLTVVSG